MDENKQNNSKKKSIIIIVLFILLLSTLIYIRRDSIFSLIFKPQQPQGVDRGLDDISSLEQDIEIVVDNLNVPWELVFVPDGGILITERPGTLVYVNDDEKKEVFNIESVRNIGEGGLLGMELHPDFSQNRYIYVYLTVEDSDIVKNMILRYTWDDEFVDETVILDNIPGDRIHNGGRIAFGPDGYLYVTTGDASNVELSQDTNSLAGKILRITEQGAVPEDNPFDNEVYSYGHRNPQGILWDSNGQLWSTEHGPSARDELNLIISGGNYGWSEIRGDEEKDGMISPVLNSGDDYTWAPSGGTYWDGSIFFAGLRGQSIYEAKIEDNEVKTFLIHFEKEYGRLRNIKIGPDDMMYILTNNTDGRGSPNENDDKLIKINPIIFR